jgi:hypothetical protein
MGRLRRGQGYKQLCANAEAQVAKILQPVSVAWAIGHVTLDPHNVTALQSIHNRG